MSFLYNASIVKLQLYANGLVWSRGRKHFKKPISYMLNSKKFSTHIFNQYLSIEKSLFADNSNVKKYHFL